MGKQRTTDKDNSSFFTDEWFENYKKQVADYKDKSLSTESGDKITKEDFGYVAGDSQQSDLRGENQGALDSWKNGVVKNVGKFALITGDTASQLLYGLPSAIATGKLSELYNNEISQGIDELSKKLDEVLPNYYTDEERNNILDSISSSNFWADKALNGVAYMASAILTGKAISGAVGAGLKGVIGGEAVGLAKSESSVIKELLKKSGWLDQKTPFIQEQLGSLLGSISESGTEARETYNSVKENLTKSKLAKKQANGDFSDLTEEEYAQIENDATTASNWNFGANMLATYGANTMQFGKLFTSKYKNEALDFNRIISKGGDLAVDELSKGQKLYQKLAKPLLNDVLSEAGQEGVQTGSNALLTDYYSQEQNPDFIQSFNKALHETFGTTEGVESMLLGAIIGGGGLAGKAAYNRLTGGKSEFTQREEDLMNAVSAVNNSNTAEQRKIMLDSFAQQEMLKQAKEKAVKNGDRLNYETLKSAEQYNTVISRVRTDRFDDYISQLEASKSMSDEDFANYWGGNVKNKTAFIDELIDKSNKIKDSYENIKVNYGHRLTEPDIEKIAFVKSMSDSFTERESQIKEKLKEFGFDYDANILQKAVENSSVEEKQQTVNDLIKDSQTLLNRITSEKSNLVDLSVDERKLKRKEIKDLEKEHNSILNDINSLQDFFINTPNDANYQDVFHRLANSTKNKLKEKRVRKFTKDSIIDPTNRQEFETLIKDMNSINKVKDEFLTIYNNMVTDGQWQKEFSKLNETVNNNKNQSKIDNLFTVNTTKTEPVVNEDGTTENKETASKEILNKGYYYTDTIQESYPDKDGNVYNVSTPKNVLEVLDRRISEKGVPEVLVSENNKEAKWKKASDFDNKNVRKLKLDNLNKEKAFYLNHKDKMITIRVPKGYTYEEYKQRVADIKAGKKEPKFGYKQKPVFNKKGEVVSYEKPETIIVSGFLGLDADGNVTFRTYNSETGKIEPFQNYKLVIGKNGNQGYDNSFDVNTVVRIYSESKTKEMLKDIAFQNKEAELTEQVEKLQAEYDDLDKRTKEGKAKKEELEKLKDILTNKRVELEEYQKVRKFAFYDERLRMDIIRFDKPKNYDDTVEVQDYTEHENRLPLVSDNGLPIEYERDENGEIIGISSFKEKAEEEELASPFFKTTNPNIPEEVDFDSLTKLQQSNLVLNNVINLADDIKSKNKVEIITANQLPDGYSSDYLDKKSKEEKDNILFAIVTDSKGTRLTFDKFGKQSPNGILAIQTLSDTNWETKSDKSYPKFRDENGLSTAQKDKIIKAATNKRNKLVEQIKAGKKVFLAINNFSHGIRNTEKEIDVNGIKTNWINKLSDVIPNFDLTDKKQKIQVANSRVLKVGNETYPSIPGQIYYTNESTGVVIPLQSSTLNTYEINKIVDSITNYHDIIEGKKQVSNVEMQFSFQNMMNNVLANYLYWGEKEENKDRSYHIYFKDNDRTIIYGNFDSSTNTYQENKVTLDDLRKKNDSYTNFVKFLATKKNNISKPKVDTALEEIQNKTGEGTYLKNLLKYVLVSNTVKSSNTKSSIIKPQWSNSYLWLGKQVSTTESTKTNNSTSTTNKTPTSNLSEKDEKELIREWLQSDKIQELNGKPITDIFINVALDKVYKNENIPPVLDKIKDLIAKKDWLPKTTEKVAPKEETFTSDNTSVLDGIEFSNEEISKLPIAKNLLNEDALEVRKAPTPKESKPSVAIGEESDEPMLSFSPDIDKETKITSNLIDKAEERLKSRYGIDVKKVTGLIRKRAFGQFVKSGKVLISDIAPIGTDYHEEFHVVEKLYLTPSERASLYDEVRKIKNNDKLTDSQASELLAEEFRYYAINEEFKSNSSFLNKLIKDIIEFIKGVIGLQNSPEIKGLFDAIYKGDFANKQKVATDNKLTVDEIQKVIKSIEHFSNRMLQAGKKSGGFGITVLQYYSDNTTRQLIDEDIREKYQNSNIAKTLNRLGIKTNSANLMLGLLGYEHIISNSDRLSTLSNGFINKIKKGENFLQVVDEYKKYLSIKKLYDETLDEDETDKSTNSTHFNNSNELDYVGKPTEIVKIFLSTIRDTNEDGTDKLNDLGLVQSVDQNFYVRMLQDDTAEIETWTELLDVLQSRPDNHVYSQLYNMFTKLDKYLDNTEPQDRGQLLTYINVTNFQNKFLQQFAKNKLDYYNGVLEHNVDTNTTTYKNILENEYQSVRSILNKAESNFNIFRLKDNKYIKDGKLVANFTGLLKALKNTKNKAVEIHNKLKLLKEFGFTFSNSDFYTDDATILENELNKVNISSDDMLDTLNNFFDSYVKNYQKTEQLNPFREKSGIDRVLQLAKIESAIVGGEYNFSLLNAQNKKQYAFQQPSTLSKIVKRLKNTIPQFKGLKFVSLAGLKKNVTIDGNENSDNGETINKLNEQDMFLTFFVNFVRDGITPYIFPGSKSMTYGFKNLHKFKMVESSADYKPYFDILKDEMNQIIDSKTFIENSQYGVTNYHVKKKGALGDSFELGVMKAVIQNKEVLNKIDELTDSKTQISDKSFDIISINGKSLRELINEDILNYVNNKVNIYQDMLQGMVIPNDIKLDNSLLHSFVVNSEYALWLQTKHITGDLAYYKDFLKRATGLMGTRKNLNLDDRFIDRFNKFFKHSAFKGDFGKTAKLVVFNDLENIDKTTFDYLTENNINSEIAKAYLENNIADAQGYESIHAFRFRMLAEGNWTDAKEKIFQKIANFDNVELSQDELDTLLNEEVDGYLNTTKPQGFTYFEYGGKKHPLFFKTAVLIPQLIRGTELEKVGKMMDDNGISMVAFESAIKVGRVVDKTTNKGLNLFDVNTNKIVDLKESDLKPFVQNIDLSFYGTQLDVNDKPKTKITIGTQEQKLILSNILRVYDELSPNHPDYEANKKWAWDTINRLDNLTVAKTEILLKQLKQELGINENGMIQNPKVLIDILTEESKQRELPNAFVDDIKFLLNNDYTLDIIARKNKLESVLLSLVANRTIKTKRKGDAKAQVSNIGFHSFDKGDIKKSEDLKFYPTDGKSKFAMEVYLPSYLSDKVNTGYEINLNDDSESNPLFQILGFRIPTQGLNSIESIIVKGFLPEYMGNTIVVPKQITAKAGSDFDIDKLNLYFPHYYIDSKGKSVYINNFTNDESLKKDYEKYLGIVDIEKDEQYEQRLETLAEKDNKDSFDEFKMKSIDNMILSTHLEILQRPENQVEMLTPNTDYDIKGIAKGQDNTDYPYDDSVRGLRNKSKSETKNDLISLHYLIARKKSFEVGKSVLGQYALHITHHVLSQISELAINPDNFTVPNFENFKNKEGRLDLIKDFDGNLISKNIEQPENASVDVEKDDYLLDLNITNETVDVAAYLTRLGLPLKQTYYFLSQPVISDYLKTYYDILADVTAITSKSDAHRKAVEFLQAKYVSKKEFNSPFNNKNLKQQISKPTNDYQSKVLSEFLRIKEEAQILSSFMQITNFDTKGLSTSFVGNDIIKTKYDNFAKDNKLNDKPFLINTNNFYERNGVKTMMGIFRDVIFEANKYFKPVFKIDSIIDTLESDYNFGIRKGILNSKYNNDKKISAMNRMKNELLTYVVRTMNNNSINNRIDDLLFGDNTIAKRIQSIQLNSKHGLNSNYLIQQLRPVVFGDKDKNDLIKLFDSNNIDTYKANLLQESFFELYNADPELTIDLIEASILQKGFQNSKDTIHNIIPAELMFEAISTFYNDGLSIDLSEFEQQLVIENIDENLFTGRTYFDRQTNKQHIDPFYNYLKQKSDKSLYFKTNDKTIKKVSTLAKIYKAKKSFKNYNLSDKSIDEKEAFESIINKIQAVKC